MHSKSCLLVAVGLFMSVAAHGAELLKLDRPQSHQVIQRIGLAQGAGYADVRVLGGLPKEARNATWEYRVVVLADGARGGSDWTEFTPTLTNDKFEGSARVAAGGWYRLEVRGRSGDDILAAAAVEPIGVGEVFVVAGQSYATNCNDERLTVADSQHRVVAFDSAKHSWAVANDPQPVFDGSDGGSIWPPLGDALAKELQVPIGFANVAIGGSSSAQWLPAGNMFPRLVAAGKSLGMFRAVLWQQGESDVLSKNTTDGYVANVTTIRETAAKAWGVDPPWLLAKSTHHPTVYNDPEGEGRIRAGIDRLVKQPGFRAGPDTDTLTGDNRGDINSRRHFTGIGQRRAAELWLASIHGELFTETETVFVEAETMLPSSGGWVATSNDQTRRASRVKTMWGADGAGDAVATATVRLEAAGRYRVWVRYMQVAAWRGPFQLAVAAGGKPVAEKVFDLEVLPDVADWEYTWQSFDADLPEGDVMLSLAKHEQKNCVGYVRHVDCLLLTTDETLVPDHLPYGPQTLVRVTIGEGYDRPVYMHLFADHYRSPWYAHYAIGRGGIHQALAPPADEMLTSGDVTPWCNLTPTVYQDSGAALNLSVRHTYHEKAAHFRAKLEFGRSNRKSDNIEIIKTFDVEATPNGLVVIAPPDLESPGNIARLKRDREFAEEVGKLADAFDWPKHGRRPVRIPFLASASIGGYELPVEAAVTQREQKTLDYFGFNGAYERILHGLWYTQQNSYCRPDLEKMRERVAHDVEQFRTSDRRVENIAACMLMDEPTGQSAAFAAQDEGYREKFRQWLQAKSISPQDLLVESWDDVHPVVEADREQYPALHYYTQLFRTRALGDFMATQRKIIEEAYGRSFPTLVNFSDGAVYHANFCGQGVDYFELLDADDQNAIWGEDWANNSSTYQCAAFNVALMQAAARKRGQSIGHYLIAHAGRTPWDIKTKATAETARGVRMWMNFSYGPNWSSHEGGPAWRSHLWHAKPELWTANAEITHEIGAVEDWLLSAKPATAEVALLYSSSSDIWTMQGNLAYGFDRMHTWVALTHAQTPVDIVPEREIERLDQYKVCYLSGPNLTREAAAKLRTWVEAGGTLFLTAGAAARDEFNRPLDTLNTLLPAERTDAVALEPFHSAGRFLNLLNTKDTVTWNGETLDVLSVRQALQPRPQAETLATFADGSPAVVSRVAGKGRVICCGFLPALSYIKPALVARRPLEEKLDAQAARLRATESLDQPEATNATASTASKLAAVEGIAPDVRDMLDRSHNPWQFSTAIRERILYPVSIAKLTASLTCDTPLVDAVELRCEQGTLIALSNHTLRPLARIELTLQTDQRIVRVDSVHRGSLPFEQLASGAIRFELPLGASDFVTTSIDQREPFAAKEAALQIGKLPVNNVLFLGNSITLHKPAPNIGWTGNWGMAASAAEKDYVHLLLGQISKAAGGKPEVMVKNIADFERRLTDYNLQQELKQELAFNADLIVIALGENASSPKTDEAKVQFASAFANLFAELRKHGQPTLLVRSQFWQDPDKDRLMKQVCTDAGGIFIDISKLGFDAANYARVERKIEHAGVAGHPGDKGMQELADALWNAIQKQASLSNQDSG